MKKKEAKTPTRNRGISRQDQEWYLQRVGMSLDATKAGKKSKAKTKKKGS